MKTKLKTNKLTWDLQRGICYYSLYTVVFLLFFVGATFSFWYYGKSFLWTADGMSQHYPNLLYIREWVREIGKNLLYNHELSIPMWDLNIGFGQDVFHAVSFRLSYLLFAFMEEEQIEIFLILRSVLSLYFCGISFSVYARNMKWDNYAILIASMIYTFSGYSLYFANRHTFFLELLFYLPLMFLGIEQILKQKKSWIFILITAICGISSYYFLFMILLPTILYACIRYAYCQHEKTIKKWLGYLIRVGLQLLLGMGLAAFSFLPGVIRFINSSRGGNVSLRDYLCFDLSYYQELLTAFLSTKQIGIFGFMGFSSLALVCLFYLFFQKGKTEKQMKLGVIIAVVIFCIPALVLVFNGLSGKTNRWSYVFALLIAMVVAYTLPHLFEADNRQLKKTLIAIGIFLIGEIILNVLNGDKMGYGYIILAVILVITLLIQEDQSKNQWVSKLILTGAVWLDIFLLSWTMYSVTEDNYISAFVNAGTVTEERNNTSLSLMENNSDQSIFRTEVIFPNYATKDKYKNYGLRSGYHGISSYFSYTDKRITDYALNLGDSQQNYSFQILDFDQRTVLDTLAGVKYITVSESALRQVPYGYELADQAEKTYVDGTSEMVYLFVNQYYLPIMYTYDTYIPVEEYDEYEPNRKEQAMLQGLVLEKEPEGYETTEVEFTDKVILTKENMISQIRDQADEEDIAICENGFLIKKDNTSFNIAMSDRMDSETYLYWENLQYNNLTWWQQKEYTLGDSYTRYQEAKYDVKNLFYEGNTTSTIVVNSHGVVKTCPLLSDRHQYFMGAKDVLVNLGYSEESKNRVKITFTKAGFYSFDDMKIISQPMYNYVDEIGALVADPIEDITIDTNTVTAHVSLQKDKLLCIAIPYSEGWSATVNGEPVELLEANGMYMGLPLQAGENDIVLTYETPGLYLGLIISGISLLLFLIWIVVWRRMYTIDVL